MCKKKILFLVPYPTEGPSARLRVGQFLPFLDEAGIAYEVRPFLTSGFYRILYKKGYALKKAALFLFCLCRRVLDVARSAFYDAVFIHREAMPIGLPIIEALLFLFNKKVIFDFDDAIYLPSEGSSPLISFLKYPRKTNFIIRHSRAVIAGNEYLKRYAARLNNSIAIIPTCIDTDIYTKLPDRRSGSRMVIGWIGSHTTQVFLKGMEEVFSSLLHKYRDLEVHLIGAQGGIMADERIIIKHWSLESEPDDLRRFDIGIMPMPDTDWTRGKCAFKAILYMSLEIPVVVSPVGVNRDIVKDGVNGFLADGRKDWEERLSRLIEDPDLRRSIGLAGRSTAEERFSLKANAPSFVEILENVCGRK